MSGECDKYGEHCLDYRCSQSITVNGESAFHHVMMPYENALAVPIPAYVNQLFGKIVVVKEEVVMKYCSKSAFDCHCSVTPPSDTKENKMNSDEIEPLVPLPLPYNPDAKIFNCVDEETGQSIGEPHSYNDYLKEIENISGINDEKDSKRNSTRFK